MMSEIQKPANADAQKQLGDAFVLGMFNEQQAERQEVPKDAEIANLLAQLTAANEARKMAEARTKELESAVIDPVDIECFRKLGQYLCNALEEDRFDVIEPLMNSCLMAFQKMEQRAESAEQRNMEAMEQEPYAFEVKHPDGCTELVYPSAVFKYRAFPDEWISQNLYSAPIPPADVAELHRECKWEFDAEHQRRVEVERENAELTRKLAEQQSQNNFDATRLRRLTTFCGVAAPDSDEELLQVAGVVIGSCLRVLESRKHEPEAPRHIYGDVCETLAECSSIRAKGN